MEIWRNPGSPGRLRIVVVVFHNLPGVTATSPRKSGFAVAYLRFLYIIVLLSDGFFTCFFHLSHHFTLCLFPVVENVDGCDFVPFIQYDQYERLLAHAV